MRRLKSLSPLVLLLAGCAGPARDGAAVPQGTTASQTTTVDEGVVISPDAVLERIAFLASDEMRGRDTPSPELDSAASYIASEFRSFGLKPGGEGGGYFQEFALQRRGLDLKGVRLEFREGAGHLTLNHGTEFAAYAGVPSEIEAPVLLVTGEITPELAGVRDKIVMVRLPGPDMTRDLARRIESQRAAARSAGAAGIIFVVDEKFPARTISITADLNGKPGGLVVGELREIPAFLLTRKGAERVERELNVDLSGFLKSDARGPGRIAAEIGSGVKVRASAPVRLAEDYRAPNVVGILPGSDPELRDTYVVLSAHFDHVGVGRPDASGDSIYNGADDNASGTAGLLEVARAFAALPEAPARSIIFLAVSGEEKGLLGSEYYSDHPTVPLEAIVANVNADMIGRNAPDSIVVIGQEYSTLGPLVQEVSRSRPELGLTVAEDIWPEQRFFFRSDHYNFARKEIPALFFFAGVHEDYHRPSDEVEKIDADKAARVSQLIFHTINEIAEQRTPPAWSEEGLREVRAMTSRGR